MIYSHTILSPIMSYYLVQIFDKNGEKVIILFDNFIKVQEKSDIFVMLYIGVFGMSIWIPPVFSRRS
jgi:hypothetical protein